MSEFVQLPVDENITLERMYKTGKYTVRMMLGMMLAENYVPSYRPFDSKLPYTGNRTNTIADRVVLK